MHSHFSVPWLSSVAASHCTLGRLTLETLTANYKVKAQIINKHKIIFSLFGRRFERKIQAPVIFSLLCRNVFALLMGWKGQR